MTELLDPISADLAVLDDPARLAILRGALLARSLDDELQAVVTEAARVSGYPVALVSLILRRTQFFRAHVGLGNELAASCATDRSVSFCQYAVAAGRPLEIRDARDDARLPQEMVQRYGIRAYFGIPLFVRGRAVGTLCVADGVARELPTSAKEALVDLARRATERLAALAPEADGGLVEAALRPAFLEMRNVLGALHGDIDFAELLLSDVAAALGLVEEAARGKLTAEELVRGASVLQGAIDSHRELVSVQANLVASSRSLQKSVLGLEASLSPETTGVEVKSAIDAAVTLSHHMTKNVGGVRFCDVPEGSISAPARMVVSSLAAALRSLAEGLPRSSSQGIDGSVHLDGGGARVVLSSNGAPAELYAAIARTLGDLGERELFTRSTPTSIELSWITTTR
jgi:GAF domain-containing protein